MSDLKRLFEPIRVGELDLPNRIVMAPLTRSRSDSAGLVPAYAADYYAQRADAGLVITEATNISPGAVGYALTPGVWSDAQVEAWKPVVEARSTSARVASSCSSGTPGGSPTPTSTTVRRPVPRRR